MFEDFELLVAKRLFLRVNLNPSALVFDVDELALAHVAVRGDASCQRDFPALTIIGARLGALFGGCEFVFERINAFGAQRRELGFALFNQRIRVVRAHLQSR